MKKSKTNTSLEDILAIFNKRQLKRGRGIQTVPLQGIYPKEIKNMHKH